MSLSAEIFHGERHFSYSISRDHSLRLSVYLQSWKPNFLVIPRIYTSKFLNR